MPAQIPIPKEQKQYSSVFNLMHQGKYDDALALCEKINTEHPESTYPYYLTGVIYTTLKKYPAALENYSKAVKLMPDNVEYLAQYGDLLRLCAHYELSEQILLETLSIQPKNEVALLGLALLNMTFNRWEEAKKLLKQVITIKPSNHVAVSKYAETCMYQDHMDEALKNAKKAISLSPSSADSYYVLANIYQILGNKKESLRQLEKTIKLDPQNGIAQYVLANSKKHTQNDLISIKRIEAKLETGMPPDSRSHFHFALAKMYDDIKDVENAFSHLKRANLLIFDNSSEKQLRISTKKIKKAYNKGWLNRHRNFGNPTEIPIFVIGMPRSGTTLIDQVLSSHSKVKSIGESIEIRTSAEDACREIRNHTAPACLTYLDDHTVNKYANRYLERALGDNQQTQRIVDKMPTNFFSLGYIYTLFPNAKIIHSQRHPLDIALSCYFQRFTENTRMNWSNDLNSIGKYYRNYIDIMNFWKSRLPIEILDIQYEDMVNDLETSSKKLLSFVGLDWENACLDFYKTKRAVKTASLWQVRQPIYNSSVNRWIPYTKHLKPLIEELGNILPEEDYQVIRDAGVDLKRPKKPFLSIFFSS